MANASIVEKCFDGPVAWLIKCLGKKDDKPISVSQSSFTSFTFEGLFKMYHLVPLEQPELQMKIFAAIIGKTKNDAELAAVWQETHLESEEETKVFQALSERNGNSYQKWRATYDVVSNTWRKIRFRCLRGNPDQRLGAFVLAQMNELVPGDDIAEIIFVWQEADPMSEMKGKNYRRIFDYAAEDVSRLSKVFDLLEGDDHMRKKIVNMVAEKIS